MSLIIGHSQTKYLSDHLDAEQYSVFSFPGFRVLDLINEEILFEVVPFFSSVVIVIGANDITNNSPDNIRLDIHHLCIQLKRRSPSAKIYVSTILPRAQNNFDGCSKPASYLRRWNCDAQELNIQLRTLALQYNWIHIITKLQLHQILVGGGPEKTLDTKPDGFLHHHEAAEILLQDNPGSISTEPPYRNSPGTVYLYSDSNDATRKDDWRADGYTWKNNGRRVYDTHGRKLIRIFFKIRNKGKVSGEFQKHVFTFLDRDYNGRTLIYYFGNNEAYEALPHGNRKTNNRPYKRTMPSVLNKIKREGIDQNPKELADKIKSEASPDSILKGVKVPRNDKQFIDILKSKIPKLSEKQVCVVTDRESGIINAFEDKLKNCKLLICWNHILNDVKFWLNKHGGKNADKRVYDSQIRRLMHCSSVNEFDELYNELKVEWSEAFVTYFEEHLYHTIVQYSGRWILEEFSMYCSYSGITNNVAESLNAKLKRLIDYKEKSIDDIVLYLHYLQGNYHYDLIRAFCGESEWTLLDEFKFAARDPDTVILPKNVCHPDKMIDLIKATISSIELTEKNERQQTFPHTDSDIPNTSNSSPEKWKIIKGLTTQHSLALKTISDNEIVLVPQMGAFMVSGRNGQKYSITLFPKETCSCPSTSRCYHIMAAMIAIGMDIPHEKKVYNLTQLRKNCRPKHAKKCGTKKGRKGDNDFDIIAAPDSELKSNPLSAVKTPRSDKKQMTGSCKKAKKTLHFENSTPKTPTNTCETLKKRKHNFEMDKSEKIPRLDPPNLSTIQEDNEISTFELSSRDNSENFNSNQMWNEYLGLTFEDIEILTENKKLNSNHMEAVNKLLKESVSGEINGLQLTEKVPVFCQKEKRWKTKVPMDPVLSPACQVHHNHHDHWVTSISHNNSIYLLDSLGSDRPIDSILTNGLKIQLSQIYGTGKSKIKVIIPSIMKQNNSVDCGLYAIALITSYCLKRKLCFDLIFDSKKMRAHLLDCLEKQEMKEFPLTDKTLSSRRKPSNVEVEIVNYCLCNLPECVDTVMVECDKCGTWYHRSCINAPLDISTQDEEFICGLC